MEWLQSEMEWFGVWWSERLKDYTEQAMETGCAHVQQVSPIGQVLDCYS